MENKFKEGQIIYEIKNPTVKLIIRRYIDRIYYCKTESDPKLDDLAFFERELTEFPISTGL